MRKELVRTSRFLSLVLRHDPAVVGIELDPSGWVDVEVLLRALARHRSPITRELLDEIVATNDKRRFEMSADARMIRAAQGHSLRVDLGLPPRTPPELLFHGTAERFLEAILREGLLPGQRDHVHLSLDLHAANNDYWTLLANYNEFVPLSFGVNESATRTANITTEFLLDGAVVHSFSDVGVTQEFVHVGAQNWNLVAGLVFDQVHMSYTLNSSTSPIPPSIRISSPPSAIRRDRSTTTRFSPTRVTRAACRSRPPWPWPGWA